VHDRSLGFGCSDGISRSLSGVAAAKKMIRTWFDKIANFPVAPVSRLKSVKRWHDVRDGQSRTRSWR
jgi:hypothetical protein